MHRRSSLHLLVHLAAVGLATGTTISCCKDTAQVIKVSASADSSAVEIPAASTDPPRNAIIIIGDGFGLGQITLTSAALFGPDGGFAVESAPVVGLMRTWCADRLVTDSAASGTAMATGYKANHRVVGITPDGRRPTNLMEAAQAAGLATGAITTSGLMDATPASFTVHHPDRHDEPPILTAMIDADHRVLAGAHWHNLEQPDVQQALDRARARGVTVARTRAEFLNASGPVVGLFDPRADSPEAGGPPLAQSLVTALRILADDDDGFVLLLESEETDEHAHDNNTEKLIQGAAELDEAVRVALTFAADQGDTLVVVTADHETGGGAITAGDIGEGTAQVRWLSGRHTATWVPVFAFGPGAAQFAGVYDNTYLGPAVARLLGLEGLPEPTRSGR